ncbi:MAG: cysteine desulfurase NifS [Clostridia bacterium]
MKIRYFDHAATTAVKEEVLKEMLPYFSIEYGNASSLYSVGRMARKGLEQARQRVASALNADAKEIYFTSCGSESDNLALKGVCYANQDKGKHIITTKIEHLAILQTCQTLERQGYEVTYLPVDAEGMVSLQELENAIKDTTILISIMFANNEIGTIEPIYEIGQIAKKHGILFHTDSVQAIGNVPIDVQKLQIDLLSMSAHKFYGPKGVGALYVREGVNFERIQDGGHQEKNKRSGTENVAGIVGLGKAIELAYQDFDKYNQKLIQLRDRYISQVEKLIPDAKLNGHRTKRLPGNTNFSFPFIEGEELLLRLDARGICASTGSACSSGNPSPSHVLLSIGLPSQMSQGTLRVTIGEENTMEDMEYLIQNLTQIVEQLRQKNPEYQS